ncbi:MAG TPA: hypothetical protein VHG51_08430 [Longimicrobiaceae bacterium]|nr:hypothetical protein [Longimicrobiaceae bacterium]
MNRLIAALGLLALAACSSGPPPEPPAPQQPWVPTPPVYALIGERSELKLTSGQVTALDSIGVALHGQNSPKLMELRDMQPSGGFRRTSADDVARARPLVDSIRENNRRAQEAVRAVLTEQQRTEVCRLYAPDRAEQRRREMQQRQQRQQPRRRELADTTVVAFRGPWLWCNPGAARSAGADTAAARSTAAPADTAARPATAAAPPRR